MSLLRLRRSFEFFTSTRLARTPPVHSGRLMLTCDKKLDSLNCYRRCTQVAQTELYLARGVDKMARTLWRYDSFFVEVRSPRYAIQG